MIREYNFKTILQGMRLSKNKLLNFANEIWT